MIKTETLKNRLSWADEKTDKEILEGFAAILLAELREIPEEDPDRQRKALHAAICAYYRRTWKCGCMAAIGAEPGVIPKC